eukprot:scaffold64069_cov24-Tisochrysis_lutea.AAC.1
MGGREGGRNCCIYGRMAGHLHSILVSWFELRTWPGASHIVWHSVKGATWQNTGAQAYRPSIACHTQQQGCPCMWFAGTMRSTLSLLCSCNTRHVLTRVELANLVHVWSI